MKLEGRRRIAVAVGLATFIASGLAVALLAVQVPGFQQACAKQCALQHKEGRLVYKGPATPKNTESASECVCL
jgi:hypothetical protein